LKDYLKKTLKEQREKEICKDKLLKASKKKIQTTMIGAIYSLEQKMSFLWDSNESVEDAAYFKNLFEELRSEILDKGNNQIRSLESEFQKYEIVYKKYYYQLPFIGNEELE
jgi:hypothetical protein